MKRLAAVRLFPIAVVVGAALGAPGLGSAATVVNGDFERGDLSGWQVHRATESGNWFAYANSTDPITNTIVTTDPIATKRGRKFPQFPPQGKFAATSDEVSPDTMILSQEIALAPGLDHRLSLLVYYDSEVPVAVPAPDTLSVDPAALSGANQQFRIDVVKPGASLESLDPADVLRTVFRTLPGGPQSLQPQWVTADLSPFAGQTVSLRIANAVHEELFTAGVDAVAVDSTRPGQAPPPLGSSRFSFGKVTLNRKNGSATLSVNVPGPGRLTVKGEAAGAKAKASKTGKPPSPLKPASVTVAKAGTVTIPLRPTPAARKTLKAKHKLRVKVVVTFDPAGGSPRTGTVPVVLELQAPRQRGR
jgi:hypothetical protein